MVDAVSDSEELFDAVRNPKSDPSSDPKVATYTTNRNSPQTLLANCEIPAIVQGVISPVHHANVDGVSICGGYLHAVRTIILEEIVTVTAPSATCVFKDPPVINWKFASSLIPIDMKTVVLSPRSNTQVLTGTGTSTPPILIRRQEIDSPRGYIGPKKSGTHIHSKLPLINFLPNLGSLRPFLVR